MKLRLSSDFAVDTDDYKREGLRFSILAMSGHGKSNAAADLVEDVLDNGAQVIVVEPIPEWHTLKARYNNVVVVGGPYQDLPLEPGFAHEYVLSVLEKGISLVVNVSDIEDDSEQLRFVSSFLWNLYRLEQKYRRVLFLVLEEADIWAPQMWDQNSKQSLSRVSLIAKHGRKIGIFPILISQRPADLHKSPLSQCNVNLFGKFTSPADLDTKTGIMFVVKKQHLAITEEQIMHLETGNFIVTDKNGVHQVRARKRLCPHGADTPLVEAKPFSADLSNALGSLRDEITKALEAKKEEESQVKHLEKQLGEMRIKYADLEQKANIKLSMKEMFDGQGSPPSASTTAIATVDKAEIERIHTKVGSLEEDKRKLQKKVEFLELKEKSLREDLSKTQKKIEAAENLASSLRTFLNFKNIYDNINRVEEKIPKNSPSGLSSEIAVVNEQPQLTIQKQRVPLTLNRSSLEGKIAIVYAEGKMPQEKAFTVSDITKAMQSHGWNQDPRTSTILDKFCQWGFFEKVKAGNRWDYRVKLAPEAAKEKGLLKEVED